MSDMRGVLNILIDGAMMLALGGMWLLWLRGSRRQDAIEHKLEAASAELEEASSQLNALMPMIRDLADPRPSPLPSRHKARQVASNPAPAEPPPASKEGGAGSQLSRLLCLHREGVAPEKIARQLDMPLAQVKLLLQVHCGAEKSS
ncbi:MAG: hypothetical protein Q9M26_05595 [Mariprofundales bacterium]|nr:hypothetical protein [Mariprofundales bacterium]